MAVDASKTKKPKKANIDIKANDFHRVISLKCILNLPGNSNINKEGKISIKSRIKAPSDSY